MMIPYVPEIGTRIRLTYKESREGFATLRETSPFFDTKKEAIIGPFDTKKEAIKYMKDRNIKVQK